MDSPQKPKKSDDEKLLAAARKRFKLCEEAEAETRREALDDLEFLAGNQWDEDVRRSREEDGRPCITANVLPTYVKQVENDIRQNRPALKVRAVDDKSDPETAKIHQGLMRAIERNSNADVAYDRAAGGAIRNSFGFFRILTEFCDPLSFDQEIRLASIPNPFSVYLDPASKEPDGSDAEFAFVSDLLTKDDFEKQYPKAELSNAEGFQALGDEAQGWMSGDHIRVVEYFYKEWKEKELLLLANGQAILKDEADKLGVPPEAVKNSRTTLVPSVKWIKMSGAEVLERAEWAGKFIPIVPVYGEELYVNGKRILKSLIRDAKDPQRMRNYWKSCETETIALAPRAPFIGYAGQFKGQEAKWAMANRKLFPYLEVNPTTINGQAAPLPQRQVYEPAIQAITMATREANEDIKATTGIYDASLGNRSNETSGIAIQRRANQAQTANFHFSDNLARSIRHGGQIILDLIPHIYDAARAVRIIGEDDEEKIVQINAMFEENGKPRQYDMGVGKYDVAVDTGPSFMTKRQEAAETLLELSTKSPIVMQAAPDIMVKNMDFPGSAEVAERIKKMLPPNITDDGKQGDMPPQIKAQMEQMGQMIDQLTGELNQAKNPLELKRMELESRERIELQKLQVDAEIEMAKLGSRESIVMLQSELAQIEGRMNLLNAQVPVGEQQPEFPQQQFEEMPQQVEQFAPAPEQFEAPPMEMPQEPTGGFTPGQSMEPMP